MPCKRDIRGGFINLAVEKPISLSHFTSTSIPKEFFEKARPPLEGELTYKRLRFSWPEPTALKTRVTVPPAEFGLESSLYTALPCWTRISVLRSWATHSKPEVGMVGIRISKVSPTFKTAEFPLIAGVMTTVFPSIPREFSAQEVNKRHANANMARF
jgi:hypothetical protein